MGTIDMCMKLRQALLIALDALTTLNAADDDRDLLCLAETDMLDAAIEAIRAALSAPAAQPVPVVPVVPPPTEERIALIVRVAELEAEVQRLRADAELLDWAEENAVAIEDECRHVGAWRIKSAAGYASGETLRAAIDAARAAERKEG